jgi:hypothetical protein
MVSSLLAIEVFNTRDASIVPELEQAVFQECNVQIDTSRSLVLNTDTFGHQAAQSLVQQDSVPCAVAGLFHDMPAQGLSALAAAMQFPVTVNRAFNFRIVSDTFSPYTSQVFPDMGTILQQLIHFLLHKGRTDFIVGLFPLSDTGTQRSGGFQLAFGALNIRHEVASYLTPLVDGGSLANVRAALERVKQTGFRTIVVAMEFVPLELPLLADAAEQQGLLSGEYFWVFSGDIDTAFVFPNNANVTKMLKGAAWLTPAELHFTEPAQDRFLKAWVRSNATQANIANAANPMKQGEAGYFFADSAYFQTFSPDYGNGFMFDATMAAAMGACLARDTNFGDKLGGNITSEAHVLGIRAVDFRGATGRVKFGRSFFDGYGSRLDSTVTWAVYNLIPSLDPFVPIALSEIYANGTWTEVSPFVYADGTTLPPMLLRDVPEQNYLSNVIRGVGLVLMGVVILLALTTVAWVYLHRDHRVLRAAQPPFLYVLALGSTISASTIIPISFDESYGWSEQKLSRACMAIPWLLSLGHIITYGALFSKLWRTNKVLQFSRRKIDVKQVAWPATILAVLALLVLSLWTGLDSFGWRRDEINEITGESIGECHSDYMTAFLAPLVVLMVLPTIMTGVMAWINKDVDGAYSESQWIVTMIVVQMEVIVVAVPTIAILRDVSTDGRYLGLMFLVLAFPMSALGCIMVPKVLAYRESFNLRPVSRRGDHIAKGSVRVSGLNENPYATDSRKEVGDRLGCDSLSTETLTPIVSTDVVEAHTSSGVPPTETPPAQQAPPANSASLGINNAIDQPSASSL